MNLRSPSHHWSWLSRRRSRVMAAAVTVILLMGFGAYAIGLAEPPWERPAVPALDEPASGHDGQVRPREHGMLISEGVREAAWPEAAQIDVVVGTQARTVEVGGLPLTMKARSGVLEVSVEVLAREHALAAGVSGVLLRIAGDGGRSLELGADYSSFADGYGGDYGSRLRIYEVPQCAALETCGEAAQPLETVNSSEEQIVTASVEPQPSGTLLAVMAEEDSSQGDYKATKLSPSSSWTAGGSSGAFVWEYPIEVPPVPGNLTPSVAIAYSSQAVDGRTAMTNNQGSWIGEGFSYEPGYIERRYKPCTEDGHPTKGDLCWAWDNATIVLDDVSGALVKDGDTWRIESDDGSRVRRVTGASNGDDNGEYWEVTTLDGTRYVFGRHQLPGWASGSPVTNSVWTAPVFGDDSGEPCHGSTFADSDCAQAWRWNLDYVVDPRGNVISYFYTRETNRYALNADTSVNGTAYHRGGHLSRIEYDQRESTIFSTPAPARVVFTVAERCLPSGSVTCQPSELNDNTASHWPDVPWDRDCPASTRCEASQLSPTFWTRKRLTTITTEIRVAGGYDQVDAWSIGHGWVSNADLSRSLWPTSITRTGEAGPGADVTLPPTELLAVQRPNRVDEIGDNISPLIRPRLATIYTDAGGQVDVSYSGEDCAPGDTPSPASNTRRCFPVRWEPPGATDVITDWFHKYRVTGVVSSDRVGESPDQVTQYQYGGGAAWRRMKPDGITDEERLTWNQWRGYRTVTVIGAPNTTLETRVEHTYFRGMDGDDDGSGGTRDVTVTDSTGAGHRDYDQLAGQQLEEITHNGGSAVSKTITTHWRHITATASHSWGGQRAAIVRPDVTTTLSALAAGGWRTTSVDNEYDTELGRLIRTDDSGNTANSADDRCTRITYADNASAHMYDYPSRTETVTVRCAATPNRATDVMSDVRTFYDGGGLGQAPSAGLATKTEELASHSGTTATYVTDTETRYDGYGRATETRNASGHKTTTVYTDTNGLNTSQTVTNPLGHVTITTMDPYRGVQVEIVDANSQRTSLAYDALGRLAGVWLANRSKAAGRSPSLRFSYHVTSNAPVAVVTETLNADAVTYRAEYELFDGWLRSRQTQAPGPGGGRLVTDTFYDALGRVAKTNDLYYAEGTPSGTLLVVDDGEVNGQTITTFDRAGRVTAEVFQIAGQERWRTTTSHGGDRVHTTPPPGGVATTVISDARGNTTELRQYHGGSPAGVFDATVYTYTRRDELAQVTDPAGNVWTYRYDQRGRKIESSDPDTGTTTYLHDDLDRLTSTTDARGVILSHTYDALDRKTATYQGDSATGTRLSQWFWDNFLKGQLAGSRTFYPDLTITVTVPFRDYLYRPNRTDYHITGTAAGALAGQYSFSTQYNIDHTIQSTTMPAAGGLPTAGVTYSYDQLRRAVNVFGAVAYTSQIDYYPTGELAQVGLFASATRSWRTFEYEQGTNRLTRSFTSVEGVNGTLADTRYTYDPAGNVTSIIDNPTASGAQRDAQCFRYDYLRRLTTAWTSAAAGGGAVACSGGPVTTGVAGPAPYWHDYGFSPVGNRTSLTVHATGTGADTVTTYTYPAAGSPRPHALQSVLTTRGTTQVAHGTYLHDSAGNTTSIDRDGSLETMTWDPQGHLASTEQSGDLTEFLYDAEGNRVLRDGPDGMTLFMPGMEVHQAAGSTTVTATRYIELPGRITYVETTGSPAEYQVSDHQETANHSINPATGVVTHRRLDPYGNLRGTTPSGWTGNRGFVGGTQDPTGYTHLGAREYDPATGRFLSVDPLVDPYDPQRLNGYIYANNAPPTFIDASGLFWDDLGQGLLSGWSQVNQAPIQFAAQTYQFVEQNVSAAVTGEQSWGQAYANWSAYQTTAVVESVACVVTCAVSAVENTGDAIDAAQEGDWEAAGENGYFAAADAGSVAMFFVGGSGAVTRLAGGFRPTRPFTRPSCRNSFEAGTTVAMADGTEVPIEGVEIGDKVLATDPATGETSAEQVVDTITGAGEKTLVEITLESDDTDGSTEVTATEDHPIWVANRGDHGEWVDAGDLRPGDQLLTQRDTTTTVESIRTYRRTATVHNLSVTEVHTFYVTVGGIGILTHNQCPAHDPGAPVDEHGNPLLPCNHSSPSCPSQRRPEIGDQVTEPHPIAEQRSQPGVPDLEDLAQISQDPSLPAALILLNVARTVANVIKSIFGGGKGRRPNRPGSGGKNFLF
jgi:RHS repeat-associated protein